MAGQPPEIYRRRWAGPLYGPSSNIDWSPFTTVRGSQDFQNTEWELEEQRWIVRRVERERYVVIQKVKSNLVSETEIAKINRVYSDAVTELRRLKLKLAILTAQQEGGGGQQVGNLGNFRTRLCNYWENLGYCRNRPPCVFAHGRAELRPMVPHILERKICNFFLDGVICPYGAGCIFRHTLN